MEKVLLDTNILIDRENHVIVDSNISKLMAILFDSDQYKIVVHPMSYDDLMNNKNGSERDIILSKIDSYAKIENPPIADQKFHDLVGIGSRRNDLIDNNLLFAVERNCVAYLVTNDNGIIKKAEKIGLGDRVVRAKDAIKLFEAIEENNIYTPVAIKSVPLHNIDVNQSFFDSLREGYKEFNKWYSKKALEGFKAYCSFLDDSDSQLGAFLYIKKEGTDEQYEGFEKKLSHNPRVKISTMKVKDKGKRIGESLIDIVFKEARAAGVSEIYTTVYPEHTDFIDLLKEYGFVEFTTKTTLDGFGVQRSEIVLLKTIESNTYPGIDWKRDTFIIPILPKYHKMLFPEAETEYQIRIADLFAENAYSNAIKKAYITKSNSNKLKPGDNVCFYLSHTRKCVTIIGTVDAVWSDFDSSQQVYELSKKRTVYNREELEKDFSEGIKIILFKKHIVLENPISCNELIDNGIIKRAPQSIQKVDSEKMKKIVENREES